MTAFAQLAHDAGLTKAASGGTMLRGLHRLVREGVWKRVADSAKPGSFWGKTSRLFHDPVANKMTMLNKGLMGYGLTGMGAQFAGYDLPGSNLAMTASTPVLGALFAAPGLITSARANRPGNQARIREDALVGARGAGSDMMSLGQMDSRFLTQPGLAQQYLRERDADTANLVDKYRTGPHQPMSRWKRMQALFENPDALIGDGVDKRIHGMMAPSAMLKSGSVGKALSTGLSNVFPWLFPTAAVGLIGHAALRDKPYDELDIQRRGYAGAQAKIQQQLGQMSGMERFALQMDPTLLASRLEKQLPGTIGTWEKTNKQRLQPGLISSFVNGRKNSGGAGEHNYYSYGVDGSRHYL
jgi:hypothetical protein